MTRVLVEIVIPSTRPRYRWLQVGDTLNLTLPLPGMKPLNQTLCELKVVSIGDETSIPDLPKKD